MWDWFIVSVLLPVTEFSWNQLVHTLKVGKVCTNYIWLSQNVLRNCSNNKKSYSVGDSNEKATIERERSLDKKKINLWVASWTERPDVSQNSWKLFCSLKWLYERLSSTILILFGSFVLKCLLQRNYSVTQWGVWIKKKYLGTTSLQR